MSSERVLNYAPAFKSFLDTSFFQELSRLKLDVLKLDSTCQPLTVNLDLHNIPKSADQVPLFLTNRNALKNTIISVLMKCLYRAVFSILMY